MSEDKSTTAILPTTMFVVDLQYHHINGEWCQTVEARKLHEVLGISTRFNDWITRRIEDYGFVQGTDYEFYSHLSKTGGRPADGYALTLDMAKELCMLERTPLGRVARQYFIACEKTLFGGAIAKRLDTLEERLISLERGVSSTYPLPAQPVLTDQGQLPPPPQRQREHAEISWHLAAVWRLLRDSHESLTNHEIAQRTGVAPRTTRAHTLYLVRLGLVDVHEVFPRHLYSVSPRAAQRNAGCLERLNLIEAMIHERQMV